MRRDLSTRTKLSLIAVKIVSQCQLVADQLEGCFTASDLQLQNIFLHSCCRSFDNTRPLCGRTQLTTTFVGDQLTVGGQEAAAVANSDS